MDREAVAKECLKIERMGGNVLEYLKGLGCISPWGTWYRLQREELGRERIQITEGRGTGTMYGNFGSRTAMCMAVIEELKAGRDPIVMLSEHGYQAPSQSYTDMKCWCKKNAPDLYEQLPENLRMWKIANGIGKAETPEANKQIRFGKMVEAPETPEQPTIKLDGAITIQAKDVGAVTVETPEGEFVKPPLKTRAVEGEFGTYHYKPRNGYLDYESHDYSGIVSMTVKDWSKFLTELHKAANELGVEL